MDIEFLKNVNIKSLPTYVREGFEQVLSKYKMHAEYEENHPSLDSLYKSAEYPVHKEFFPKLGELFQNEDLFIDDIVKIRPSDSFDFDGYYELVGKCSKNGRDYYRFRDKVKCANFILSKYKLGFYSGFYDELFRDAAKEAYFYNFSNEFLVNKIFSLAYRNNEILSFNLSIAMDESYERSVFNSYNLVMYAQKVGEFMNAWEIITQYPDRFEPLFKSRNLKLEQRSLQSEVIDFLDVRDSSNADLVRRIYLMGIIDYVKELFPPNTKNNRLAVALSCITPVKVATMQSYTNPINSCDSTINQKNNPLENDDKVEVERQKLISLGINPKKLKKNKF